MQEQKDRAKAAAEKISVTGDMKYAKVENEVGSTEFVGYLVDCAQAKILAAIEGEGYTDIVLDRTPFYAECGGQVGDSGYIVNENLKAEVLTTFKVNHLLYTDVRLLTERLKLVIMLLRKLILQEGRKLEFTIHLLTYCRLL